LQAPHVLKEVDKAQARRGGIVTYTIRYDNDSPSAPEAFQIVDSIPAGSVYVMNSAELDNQPHTGAAFSVWYYDGSTWQDSTWDDDPNHHPQRIKWVASADLGPDDNSELTDTGAVCDGEFPDSDSGIVRFRVIVE